MIPRHATLLGSEVKDASVLLTLALPSAPTDPAASPLTLEVSPDDGVNLIQFGGVMGPDRQPTGTFALVFARHWWESYDEKADFGQEHYDWKSTLETSQPVARACIEHWREVVRHSDLQRRAYRLLKVRRVSDQLLLKVQRSDLDFTQTFTLQPAGLETLLFVKRDADGQRSLVFGYLDELGQSEWTFTATGGQRVVARFMRHYDALMGQAERPAREDVQPVPLHSAAD